MKLKECLDFGKNCGLKTLDECVLNIEIHATLLFPYTKINKELNELYEDLKVKEPEYYASHYKERGEE